MRKKAAVLLLALAASSLTSGCYVVRQGVALLGHQVRARNNEKILSSRDVEGDVRAMMLLVQEVRDYAESVLGLSADKNYTKLVRVERDYLVDVVSACEKDYFEPYEWWFPIVGKVPYKGYYRREDALRLARRLQRKDLDVLVRKVDAFSTLGFFVDPLYSFMADYSMFSIADLIIHEQTHATVFLKNQVQFNEELATFVGWEGALDFIRRRCGEDSEELREGRASLADSQTYFALMLELHDELERLYVESRKAGLPKAEVLGAREEIFEAFRESFPETRGEVFLSERFQNMETPPLNNAYLMSFVRYGQDLDLFYELHRSLGSDLSRTVAVIKELEDVKTDPKAFLRTRIREQ